MIVARVLGSNRVGLAVMALVAVAVLVLVIFWVKGCRKEVPEQAPGPVVNDGQGGIFSGTEGTDTQPPDGEPDVWREPPKPEPIVEKTMYETWYDAGRDAFDLKEYVAARDQLSRALKGIKNPLRLQAKRQLATIAKELTFSRQIVAGDTTVEVYTVKQGEIPASVAKKYAITAELFMKINNIPNEWSMRAGRDYKVINGPFNIVVHKKTFELEVFLGDYFITKYTIGLGRDNSTPLGEFLAGSRLKRPPWPGEDKKTGRRVYIKYGEPDYPLGEHWISLQKDGKNTAYGIHGTDKPQTIGAQDSRGCIRMYDKDIAELYDLLVTGKSRITVVDD